MFHKNTELLPSCDSSEISPGKNNPTKDITLLLVGIPFINQLVWVNIAQEY